MKRREFINVLTSVPAFLALNQAGSAWAAAQAAPKHISVGMCLSITGRFAPQYNPMGRWVEALTEIFNERGGVYVKEYDKRLPIKAVWYDDKGDPPTCIKFYERLISVDKVDFFLGPTASPQGIAGSTVAEKYKIPMILTSSNDPKIFDRGFKWISSCLDKASSWMVQYLHMLKEQTDAKTIALLTEDSVWSMGIRGGVQKITKELGFDLVYDKVAPTETRDFTSVIMELKQIKPDVVAVPSWVSFLTDFTKQALDQGLKPKAFHGCNAATPAFVDSIGKDHVNYMTGEVYWVYGVKTTGSDIMEEALKRSKISVLEYPIGPANNLAAWQILLKAIEITGSLDRAKVQQTLETMEIEFLGGKWKRYPDGAGTYNPGPMQFDNGERHVVYPREVATHKFIYPIPWK
jgi:branched-chain amino acid transport system substrate-binding protein